MGHLATGWNLLKLTHINGGPEKDNGNPVAGTLSPSNQEEGDSSHMYTLLSTGKQSRSFCLHRVDQKLSGYRNKNWLLEGIISSHVGISTKGNETKPKGSRQQFVWLIALVWPDQTAA